MNTSEYVCIHRSGGFKTVSSDPAVSKSDVAVHSVQPKHTTPKHMPDSDVIDTGAAVSDAVREAAKRMGLQQPTPMASCESKVRIKRKASPARHGVLWQSVEIVK